MTSPLNSHRTTDIKPEMLLGVQTGNGPPHDKYNIRGIAHARTNREEHFHAKTTSAKLYIYIGVGSRDLFIDEAHMALGIFPLFFPCMLPTPHCGIFLFFFTNGEEGPGVIPLVEDSTIFLAHPLQGCKNVLIFLTPSAVI